MMPKTETSGDDGAEEWLTLVNWEEDLAIKTEQRKKFTVSPWTCCTSSSDNISCFGIFDKNC